MLKCRLRGREQLPTFARFPELGRVRPRMCALEAKAQLANDLDARHAADADTSGTFEQLARAGHRHHRPTWSATCHRRTVQLRV